MASTERYRAKDVKVHLMDRVIHTATKSNSRSIIDKQFAELVTKVETLEGGDGKSRSSQLTLIKQNL